ncbi:glycoside hydrolase family 13 protein [Dactylosporangium sp. NPDC000521]|uniref:glycoside hydrolase family 13 protein n=1 Tax=Dactylosporangium sp. NPDC000521 TaxID=3363975 RepID=UPI0036BE042F
MTAPDLGFHHDGSADHVSTLTPEPGEAVTVFVRTPRTQREGVFVRTVRDGEPHFTAAVADRETDDEIWWRADITVHNPVTQYRFLATGSAGYRWLNAAGLWSHDVPDTADFRLVGHPPPPNWAADAVAYEIFPDRFARSDAVTAPPGWAFAADWDDPVQGHGEGAARQLYGGDLHGVRERLDHIGSLGANLLWLTPVFPARSNHRYNASTFEHVDPLLGGDAAYRTLIDEVHARGWRIVGDLTTNHCGDDHPWFTAAMSQEASAERGFFWFTGGRPGYESWMGVPSLPKFNWSDPELVERMVARPDSIIRRWLRTGLDGWRIDVANMTGRHHDANLTTEVAARILQAATTERPDALLIAEHAHDATADLDTGGWHATMNYAGFTRPVWTWLRGEDTRLEFLGLPTHVPRLGGKDAVRTMRMFAAQMSWRTYTHCWSVLSSHDTARIRTVCGSPDLTKVAAGLAYTLPGTPMIFAGDEIGLRGDFGEDGRRPMPWHRTSTWDTDLLATYRALGALRARETSLRHGGLRWLHVGDDVAVFAREHAGETVLVQAARAAHQPVRIRLRTEAESIFGDGPRLMPNREGWTGLPGDGPAFRVWRY